MTTPVRPLVLHRTPSAEAASQTGLTGSHFDDVASVNAWREEDKLLKVRLTGRAQTASQHLSEANIRKRIDFAYNLKSIEDKAYPDLKEKAREQLALNAYLSQLDHTQVEFVVKQLNPANLDAAVSSTLELETYAAPKMAPLPVLGVPEDDLEEEDMSTVGAVNQSDKLADVIRGLSERLDRQLEANKRARNREQGAHTQQADLTTS